MTTTNILFLFYLSILSFLSFASGRSVMSDLTPDYHSQDERLPAVMNAIIAQITAIRILNNENENNEKIESLFLVMSYSEYSHYLMVLTQNNEYYVITPEKTYCISEYMSQIPQQYKLLYYENIDKDSLITLQDVEKYMKIINLL